MNITSTINCCYYITSIHHLIVSISFISLSLWINLFLLFSAGDFLTLTHSNNPSSSTTLLHNWTDKMTTRILSTQLLVTVPTRTVNQFNSPQSARSRDPSPGLHCWTLDAWCVFLGSYYCHFLLAGSLGHCSAAAGLLGPNTDDHLRAPRATEPN